MFHGIPSSSSLSVLHCHNEASCYDLTASPDRWVLSIPYHSHYFSHLNYVLVCLILAIFSYRFFFYSLEIFSQTMDLFLVLLPSYMCTLNTRSFTIKLPRSNLVLYNIYRPPRSTTKSRHSVSFSQFLEDFQTLIASVSTSPHEFLIAGDFNIHVDDLADSNATQFLSLLDNTNLTQHVFFPTHWHSHTLHIICLLKITKSPTAPIAKYLTRAIFVL